MRLFCSPELAAMLLASVIGGYTLIGGLGATFYVSYFNTALIFILILMLVAEVSMNYLNRNFLNYVVRSFSRLQKPHCEINIFQPTI